jgi:hypothetical protein
MNAFTFPQPGERTNATTIPVAEHTLAALYALALVGQGHLTTNDVSFLAPQCKDALREVGIMLSPESFEVATLTATRMETELRDEFPF